MKDENIDIEEGQKKGLWHTIEEESSKRKARFRRGNSLAQARYSPIIFTKTRFFRRPSNSP
jgi:hypothetical protein